MDRLFLYKLMDKNSFINVCMTKPKEENHWPLIYQTLLLYQRDELVVLLGLLLVIGVLLLFVQLLAHVLDQLLHGEVEHQLENMGGHHPTLDHLVHASYLGDQEVIA
ncbi:uncharacterized protein LOC126720773 isoform X3 [Quercus robur]|uniref:uncharacterized protein LOC126720773 isoform X3 n=1 Tax=Quercus robur TaxID=38942 RepID=UPI002162F14D|nr:uncharacterized protein LOC126720773 isoform X3 [Quercus robur]